MGPDGVHPQGCGSWGRWGLVPCLLWPWVMEEQIHPWLGGGGFLRYGWCSLWGAKDGRERPLPPWQEGQPRG